MMMVVVVVVVIIVVIIIIIIVIVVNIITFTITEEWPVMFVIVTDVAIINIVTVFIMLINTGHSHLGHSHFVAMVTIVVVCGGSDGYLHHPLASLLFFPLFFSVYGTSTCLLLHKVWDQYHLISNKNG
jgi:hypothetical protein